MATKQACHETFRSDDCWIMAFRFDLENDVTVSGGGEMVMKKLNEVVNNLVTVRCGTIVVDGVVLSLVDGEED